MLFRFAAVLMSASITLPLNAALAFSISSRDAGQIVHCGTTSDATLSDCQQLVQPDTWNSVFAGSTNECQ